LSTQDPLYGAIARRDAINVQPRSQAGVVILAGGKGLRMRRDAGEGATKLLTQICGRSLLSWTVEIARHLSDEVVVLGDHDSRIVESEARRLGADFFRARAEPGPRLQSLAASLANEDLIVLSGDTLTHPENHRRVLSAHQEGGSTVGLSVQDAPGDSQWRLTDDLQRIEPTAERTAYERTCWVVERELLLAHGLRQSDDPVKGRAQPSGFEWGSVNALIDEVSRAGVRTSFVVGHDEVVNVNRTSDIPRAETFVREHLS
jgi:hypothetical protein